MLENTLRTKYLPESNLTGGLAHTAWRFLLPSQEGRHTLCVGVPDMGTLRALATMSTQLTVIAGRPQDIAALNDELSRHARTEKIAICRDFRQAPLESDRLSLVHLAGASGLRVAADRTFLSWLQPRMGRDAVVHCQLNSWALQLRHWHHLRALTKALGAADRFWVTPLRGELQTAFPLEERALVPYVFQNILYGNSRRKRLLSLAARAFTRIHILPGLAPRKMLLFRANGDFSPPKYLESAALRCGLDLSGMLVGLSARGLYNSNKTIFYFMPPDSRQPSLVVKMCRAPEFNHRLENEHHALRLVRERQLLPEDAFPQPLFFDRHAGLALMGQAAINGHPFRVRTSGTENCRLALEALRLLVTLGIRSADRAAATTADAGGVLGRLLTSFAASYPVNAAEHRFLQAQVQALQKACIPFPTVLQHGDPGTWNLMVTDSDGIVFLDWESAEPQGMPLWDIFYFLQTYVNWMARSHGVGDLRTHFRQTLLRPSQMSALLAETVADYAREIGLPTQAIVPLFYFCWLHRALKESMRLRRSELDKGQYFNLLRLCIEEKREAEAILLKNMAASATTRVG